MKLKKYKKYFLFVALFAVVIFLTFYTIFSNTSIEDLAYDLKTIKIRYILICLGLLLLYFMLQGIYMKRNLKLMNKKINIFTGIFYSIVEFFFSGITPSASGGQPVQLYYMSKDKITKKKAFITLLINTIYFKAIIVIFGVIIAILYYDVIFSISPLFTFFYFIGVVFDLFLSVGGYLLLYKPIILKKILEVIEKFVKLFYKNYEMKIDDNIEVYSNEVKVLQHHKLELFFEFVITLIQRICMFSISYVVYKAFGLNDYSFIQIMAIQISVQTAIEFVPLPGGTGVSEYLFNVFFITVFGSSIAPAAMLLTRTFSFYVPLLICGIILLVNYLKDNFYLKNKAS